MKEWSGKNYNSAKTQNITKKIQITETNYISKKHRTSLTPLRLPVDSDFC